MFQNISFRFDMRLFELLLCGKILFLEYRDGFGLWGNVCIKAAAAAKKSVKEKNQARKRERRGFENKNPGEYARYVSCFFILLKTKEEKEKEESGKTVQEMFYDSRFHI